MAVTDLAICLTQPYYTELINEFFPEGKIKW